MANRPVRTIRDPHNQRIPARATQPSADGEDDPEWQGAWRVNRKSHEKRY